MLRKAEHNQKIALAHKGKKHGYSSTLGRVGIHKDTCNKFVLKADLENFLNDGWILGLTSRKGRDIDELS